MTTRFTVKVILQAKNDLPGADMVPLTFAPDYQDGRNKEWAAATPALSLTMSVKRELADQLQPGQRLTGTFEVDGGEYPQDEEKARG